MLYCIVLSMTQNVCEKTEKDRGHEHSSPAEPDEFDMDLAIRSMKKVGYRNSEGLLILPKYYDE